MGQNFTGPIEDRLAIREVLETYADAIYRSDDELWASIWADDAAWEFPHRPEIGTIKGKDKLVEMWSHASAAYPNLSVMAMPGSIHVTGDTATARIYLSEKYEGADGRVRHGRPSYHDRYVKRDARWLIHNRVSFPRDYTS